MPYLQDEHFWWCINIGQIKIHESSTQVTDHHTLPFLRPLWYGTADRTSIVTCLHNNCWALVQALAGKVEYISQGAIHATEL